MVAILKATHMELLLGVLQQLITTFLQKEPALPQNVAQYTAHFEVKLVEFLLSSLLSIHWTYKILIYHTYFFTVIIKKFY